MPLAVGSQIAHCIVTALIGGIGEGGMGQVWGRWSPVRGKKHRLRSLSGADTELRESANNNLFIFALPE